MLFFGFWVQKYYFLFKNENPTDKKTPFCSHHQEKFRIFAQ